MNTITNNPAAMADHFDSLADDLSAEYTDLTDDQRVRYVVECDGLLINVFATGNGLGEKVATLHNVPTFAKFDRALTYAERVVNGKGTKGKVVTLGSAYLDTIGKYRDIAVTIRNANGIAN